MAAITTINVDGIQATGCHGVYAHEKSAPQRFAVDLECVVIRPCVDDLSATADYGDLAASAAEIVGSESFDLIETLAERIAARCLEFGPVVRATVRVHKLGVPLPVTVADLSVTVTLDKETT